MYYEIAVPPNAPFESHRSFYLLLLLHQSLEGKTREEEEEKMKMKTMMMIQEIKDQSSGIVTSSAELPRERALDEEMRARKPSRRLPSFFSLY